ncbi:hypothetical protein N9Y33_04325 [Bacteroidia bacterium]|nr:hypothetical protein [Bacteroidia bacterium]
MKFFNQAKLTTKAHSNYINDSDSSILNAKLHFDIFSKQHKETYRDLRSVIERYGFEDMGKRDAIEDFYHFIRSNDFKNILSIGSGPGIIELFLSFLGSGKYKLTASDYNLYQVDRMSTLLQGNIDYVHFDLFNSEHVQRIRTSGIDCVVLFGSSYVMDDSRYRKFFDVLRQDGIAYVDFYAGCLPKYKLFFHNLWRKKGLVHGYARSKNHIINLHASHGQISKNYKLYKQSIYFNPKNNDK